MIISYIGHSCFKIKGKRGTIITDPYHEYIGFALPGLSADIITVSHDLEDHNNIKAISGTTRRKNPFIVDQPGEYEVAGLSVFGVATWQDASQGAERGGNIVYTCLVDDLRICHLGDLGHELTSEQLEEIGSADILLCPVGGVFTINPAQAVKIIRSLEPSIVIPMHYKTPQHKEEVFGELASLDDFIKEYGAEVEPVEKLEIEKSRLPEETELIVLKQTVS